MKDIETYLEKLQAELRDLPEDERADIVAEIKSHIEAGLEDDAANGPDSKQYLRLLQELGSPAEFARNRHRVNWKRHLRLAGLALIPLLLMNPQGILIDDLLGITPLATAVGYVIDFLICLAMLWLAKRLRSNLLLGWWLANAQTVAFNQFFFMVSWPFQWFSGSIWNIMPLILMIVVAGFYGRFLWQNRYDGITITMALIPFMWTTTYLMAYGAVMNVINYLWRSMLTVNFSIFAWAVVVLAAFLLPGRLQRWVALFIITALFAMGTFIIWLPDPNAIFWLLMFFPILLGFGIELASVRTTKLRLPVG